MLSVSLSPLTVSLFYVQKRSQIGPFLLFGFRRGSPALFVNEKINEETNHQERVECF